MLIPDALMPAVIRVRRSKRVFESPRLARRRISERALRPSRFSPPARVMRGVDIGVEREDGWPIYSVTPRPADGATTPDLPVVVYLHGGAWVNEIDPFHWRLVRELSTGIAARVVVPIYPLVPFGTAESVVRRVAALASTARRNSPAVALVGDSAGGQIALSAALLLRDAGTPPDLTALISPALDLSWSNPHIPRVQPTDPWLAVPGGRVFSDAWRAELPVEDPLVSPLGADLSGLGRVTLFTGTRDILNPDARLLRDLLERADVETTFHEAAGRLHVFPLLPTPSGRRARERLTSELRATLHSH